jgi:hypothetical protein
MTSLIVIFDGSFVGTDPPLRLVVTDRRTGRTAYSSGPWRGAQAVNEAKEAARVIRVMGIEGYIDRERQ